MTFGFSYVGLLYLLLLFVPNLFWTKNQPKDYDKYVMNEKRWLLVLERAGQMLVTCVALIFSDFNLHAITPWSGWLFLSFLAMLFYEVYWFRYFKSSKTLADFYSSLLGIPVAGATLPVIGFLLLGIYGKNLFLIVAVLILGVGHIGIHLEHRKEIVSP